MESRKRACYSIKIQSGLHSTRLIFLGETIADSISVIFYSVFTSTNLFCIVTVIAI